MLSAHVQLLWCITQPHALSAILDSRISCITHSCTQGLQLFLGVVNLVMMQTFCVFWLMVPAWCCRSVKQPASSPRKLRAWTCGSPIPRVPELFCPRYSSHTAVLASCKCSLVCSIMVLPTIVPMYVNTLCCSACF